MSSFPDWRRYLCEVLDDSTVTIGPPYSWKPVSKWLVLAFFSLVLPNPFATNSKLPMGQIYSWNHVLKGLILAAAFSLVLPNHCPTNSKLPMGQIYSWNPVMHIAELDSPVWCVVGWLSLHKKKFNKSLLCCIIHVQCFFMLCYSFYQNCMHCNHIVIC